MKTAIALSFSALGAIGIGPMLGGIHLPFISDGYTPAQECVQWYDGCNMCQKQPDGIVTCTNRVCGQTGAGFCMSTSTAQQQ